MNSQSIGVFDQRFGAADDRKPQVDDHVHKAGNATRDRITQVFEKQGKLTARLKQTSVASSPA